MSHHQAHDPMKGHHRVVQLKRKRWWHPIVLRRRSDEGDYVVRVAWPYPFPVYSYVSGHKDAPLTPRARVLWSLAFVLITGGGVALILWVR